MNHYHRFVAAVGLSWCLLLGAAWGQAGAGLPRPTLPTAMKNATTIDQAAGAQIDQAVQGYFKRMMESDTDVQKAAREAVVADAKVGSGEASPAYVSRYAQAIATALASPDVAGAKDIRAKFNAALAVAKVAEATKTPKLEPALLTLLEDNQNPAVKLAAIKASKAILPELAKAKAQQKLAERVAAAVKASPSGAMTAEAYEALRDRAMIDNLLDVLTYRISLYKKVPPEDPNADATPFLFLQGIWTSGPSEAQKVKLLTAAYQGLTLASAQAGANAAGAAQRDQLIYMIQKVAESLSIIAKNPPAPTLESEAKRLAQNAGPNTDLAAAVKGTCAEIKKLKGCEKIEDVKVE